MTAGRSQMDINKMYLAYILAVYFIHVFNFANFWYVIMLFDMFVLLYLFLLMYILAGNNNNQFRYSCYFETKTIVALFIHYI